MLNTHKKIFAVALSLFASAGGNARAWEPALEPLASFQEGMESPAAWRLANAIKGPESVAGQEVDALGQKVTPEARAYYARVMDSLGKRRLSAAEKSLVLTLLNHPKADPGPFKDREALVVHFARNGVGVNGVESGFQDSDTWRLVRAVRAASKHFRIPPAILLCLTFRESSFKARAANWTTSAKGVGQMTNPAVADTVDQIQRYPDLLASAEGYARELGAELPKQVTGTPDVDALNLEIQRLQKAHAPESVIKQKKLEKQQAILKHKDEPGHIFNLETNFGLSAAYLTYIRRHRLSMVNEEVKGWLTAVGAYNQGLGTAYQHINKVFAGPADYNNRSLDEIYDPATVARLSISPERQHEMIGEVGSVRRCSLPN